MDPRGALRAFSNIVESNRRSVEEEKERESITISSRFDGVKGNGEKVFFSKRQLTPLKSNSNNKDDKNVKPFAPSGTSTLETIRENNSSPLGSMTVEDRYKILEVNVKVDRVINEN